MLELTSNVDSFINSFAKIETLPKRGLSERIKRIAWTAHVSITSRTPVWSGRALRNYVWTIDALWDGPPLDALGTGDPGHTNDMPLGTEPRRALNQEAADRSFEGLSFTDPFHAFILSNAAETIEGLEYGLLPPPPLKQRSPEGMFRITFAEVIERVESGAL